MNEIDYFEQGRKAARAYYESQSFATYSVNAKAEDIIKLFWPPENEALMMVSTPFPKPKQKWLAGFKKEQAIIMVEREDFNYAWFKNSKTNQVIVRFNGKEIGRGNNLGEAQMIEDEHKQSLHPKNGE